MLDKNVLDKSSPVFYTLDNMGIYSLESVVCDRMTYSKRRNSCPPQAFDRYGDGQDWQSLLAQHGRFLQHRMFNSNSEYIL